MNYELKNKESQIYPIKTINYRRFYKAGNKLSELGFSPTK